MKNSCSNNLFQAFPPADVVVFAAIGAFLSVRAKHPSCLPIQRVLTVRPPRQLMIPVGCEHRLRELKHRLLLFLCGNAQTPSRVTKL